MMKNPDFDDNWRNDTNQQREADSLSQIGWQLCGFDIRTGETEIKKWRSMTDVELLPTMLPFLDKAWIYVGKGEDITKDRIYIRDKLNAWVEGSIRLDDHHDCSRVESFSLQPALEPFDIWVPCSMLDEYCCLSDIPGVFICVNGLLTAQCATINRKNVSHTPYFQDAVML